MKIFTNKVLDVMLKDKMLFLANCALHIKETIAVGYK